MCPPPPNFSNITCTLISPIERPLIHTLSPKFPITKDAVISLIVNNSSAAFAHIKLTSFVFLSYIDIAIVSFTISAFFTTSAILLKLFRSLWNHFLTLIISTPASS